MDLNTLFAAPQFLSAPHRRLNALTGDWVLISPHRTQRPWQGQVEKTPPDQRPTYDPTCYLCPGNMRAGGVHNPAYTTTFVFDNDYAALLPNTSPEKWDAADLIVAQAERGICRVVCFSPRHDLTLAQMDVVDIRRVVDVWSDQYEELGAVPWVNHVQIFENRGAMMGASNPHPHGQIWADETIPLEPAKEILRCGEYKAQSGHCLLCDYQAFELEANTRIVCANDHFVVVVPFWAVWPFETLLLPRRHVNTMTDLDSDERDGLADIMKHLLIHYDNVFEVSFPYSMGFHQRPTDQKAYPELHLHAHYYPPLLRSATVRKFMVGYEMLGQPQRDITPEQAADRLRAISEIHYTQRG
jgi:UDPglucose--hexose-1-phosphate uridylyltransferase